MADQAATKTKKTLDSYHVIIRPLITEKGTFQSERFNSYAFEVVPDADKGMIKEAVEKLFDVRVLDVRTANRKGKPRRVGRSFGVTRRWKRAIVLLHEDDRIDFY